MKIGILTYHRAHNYGALMQAIATRVVLENMGYEVYYVDYYPDYHKDLYKIFSWDKLSRMSLKYKVRYILKVLKKHKIMKQRISNFNNFIEDYIKPYCKPVTDTFDIIVIGSDQVWRKQSALKDYNPVYFGQNGYKASKQITYAVSMGILPQNEKDKQRFFDLVSSLDSVSVREESLKNLILEKNPSVYLHLDPTLLLDQNTWSSILPDKRTDDQPYVLHYCFQGNAFDSKTIHDFAAKRGCTVKTIVGTVPEKEIEGELPAVGPSGFIELVRNSEFVFTSSFHGLAFSLIFHKQFFASYTKNSGRAESLLNILGLSHRLLTPSGTLFEVVDDIDYNLVDKKLEVLREPSLNYLKNLSV